MKAASIAAVFGLYTVALVAWLGFVGQVALLEADVGERFIRLSGWPTQLAALGLIWTLLLAAAVLEAIRAHPPVRQRSLLVIAPLAIAVTVLVPISFRRLGYFGISTSEFLDAVFPLLGGLLPGGQATLGLLIVCAVLTVLTVASFGRRSPRARQT